MSRLVEKGTYPIADRKTRSLLQLTDLFKYSQYVDVYRCCDSKQFLRLQELLFICLLRHKNIILIIIIIIIILLIICLFFAY
jgi:hypothetical protein